MIINELIGKILIKIEQNNDALYFHLTNGAIYKQHHRQDCCECVDIEDINGNLDDLLYYPLLQAEENTQEDTNASESGTWTFYKFATINGYVTIRWYGSSNGYYSETAEIEKIKEEDPIKEQRLKKLNILIDLYS